MKQKIFASMHTADVRVVRINLPMIEGYYLPHKKRVRIGLHSHRPWERLLIHELLHHLYPDKPESWVKKHEERIWLSITRRELALLTAKVHTAHRHRTARIARTRQKK